MRRWEVPAFGAPWVLRQDLPDPVPGPGRVALRMKAWSVNYRDLLMTRGAYDPRLSLPYVPLSDGVGEVVALGDGVTRVAVGDRVCPTFSPGWLAGDPDPDAVRKTRGGPLPGVLADTVVVSEQELVRVPAHLSDAAAATLPCAALTAWSALRLGDLRPGDTVLVLGSGGVALWALQLARAAGARVVATTSSPEKAARLRALGAAHVVSRTEEPRWGRAVRRWAGDGVDLVIEVGGAGTLEQSLEATRVGGTVAMIGVLAGGREPVSVLPLLMRQIRAQGVFVGHRQGFEALTRAVALHGIEPVVDRVFPFEDAQRAVDALADGAHFGKLAISAPR